MPFKSYIAIPRDKVKSLAERIKDTDILAKAGAYEGIVYLVMGELKVEFQKHKKT
ncbi:MAG: hypothetical protein ABDH49_05510 [Candidatus Hydrothermales bacterium]